MTPFTHILVFDTETTGLFSKQMCALSDMPWIVQFSYLLYNIKTQKIEDVHDCYIRLPPNVDISPESSNIHGVTRAMVDAKGIPIAQALTPFFRHLTNYSKKVLLVAHNASFDLWMIKVALKRILMSLSICICTRSMSMYKQYYETLKEMELAKNPKRIRCTLQENIHRCKLPNNKYPKLVELHQHLFQTIPDPNHMHNSLHDILVTLRCFLKTEYDVDLFLELKKNEWKNEEKKNDKKKGNKIQKEYKNLAQICSILV